MNHTYKEKKQKLLARLFGLHWMISRLAVLGVAAAVYRLSVTESSHEIGDMLLMIFGCCLVFGLSLGLHFFLGQWIRGPEFGTTRIGMRLCGRYRKMRSKLLA